MSKGRGGGNIHPRLVQLVSEAVARSSQVVVARDAGVTRLTIQRCLKGVGEPSLETYQKLANYFNETFVIEIKPRKDKE